MKLTFALVGNQNCGKSTLFNYLTGSALQNLFSPLTALSFLTFALLYPPCVAALAAIKREMNSGIATIAIMAYEISVAWLAAFTVYHIGLMLGFN